MRLIPGRRPTGQKPPFHEKALYEKRFPALSRFVNPFFPGGGKAAPGKARAAPFWGARPQKAAAAERKGS